MDLHSFTVDLDLWGTCSKPGLPESLLIGCKLSLDSACMVVSITSGDSRPQMRVPYHNIDFIHRANSQTMALVFKTNDIWRLKFGHSSELSRASERVNQLKSGSLDSAKTFAVTFDMPELRDLFDSVGWNLYSIKEELERMNLSFDMWRISEVNKNWRLSEAMPELLVVPAAIDDDILLKVSQFRSSNRIPYLTYHHAKTSAFIARTSQPLIGSKGRRSMDDEEYLKIMFSCRKSSDSDNPNLPCIVDTRTKQTATSAKLRGGGSESDGNYVAIRTFFTTIEQPGNIKDVYCKFIDTIRNVDVSMSSYLNDTCGWFKLVQSCLRPAVFIAKTITEQGAPVLIHCDDGIDNSSLVSSLAKLLIDPYYRTLKGFMILIEEEWIQAGYRFSERSNLSTSGSSGSGTTTTIGGISLPSINLPSASASQSSIFTGSLSQMVPVTDSPLFILFLDCVYQTWSQFPTEFEFNLEFMCSLFQHTTSSQFGTFLNNSPREYREMQSQSLSLWSYFNSPQFRPHFINPFYNPLFENAGEAPYLPVSVNPKLLHVFSGFYDPFYVNSPLSKWNSTKFCVDITGPLIQLSDNYNAVDRVSLVNRKKMELDQRIAEKLSSVSTKLNALKLKTVSISGQKTPTITKLKEEEEVDLETITSEYDNNWDPLLNST